MTNTVHAAVTRAAADAALAVVHVAHAALVAAEAAHTAALAAETTEKPLKHRWCYNCGMELVPVMKRAHPFLCYQCRETKS